jgi:hypothetical protein
MKKTIANIIYALLLGSFILLLLYKMYIRHNTSTLSIQTINYLMGGVLLAAFFVRISFRVFPNWYKEEGSEEETED